MPNNPCSNFFLVHLVELFSGKHDKDGQVVELLVAGGATFASIVARPISVDGLFRQA
jgi:hypothetical protein